MTERTTTQAFFEPATGTVSYIVWVRATRHAAVIDPVLDYNRLPPADENGVAYLRIPLNTLPSRA